MIKQTVISIYFFFVFLVSTQAGDAFSRKTTMSISIIGSIAGLLTLSIYLYLQQNGYDVSNYTWLPLVTLSLIIFISSSGIIAITNTFVIEFFPSNASYHLIYLIRTQLKYTFFNKFTDSNGGNDLVFSM